MSESILVVEYEPRYTDRVRQALSDQPFTPIFAKDGEEALRGLDGEPPKLIVLSSVVPKISTTELIRTIRGRAPLRETPILLTVSGYNGKSPQADAQRVGASDILPKPYSESDFLAKMQQVLGIAPEATAAPGMTSADMFGDLVDPRPAAKKPPTRASDDVDKMLADTLGGMMPPKRTDRAASPAQQPKRATSDLDRMLADTLSGIEKEARKTSGGTTPRPAPQAAETPAPPPRVADASPGDYVADRVPASQPVLPNRVPPAPRDAAAHDVSGNETIRMPLASLAPVADAAKLEDEEPTDGIRFGQYVLVEKIATGGMAEVWKARMRGVEGFQKIVAIKKILPHLSDNQDFIEMFVDEAKLAAQLNHNNIIHIYDLGKIQSSYYIAMEYIDGFDLKTILRRGQERDHPMSVELALFVASKVAAALDYAHRKKDFEEREMGLVHRDVSPQNVLISQEGDIKLCDFGIAKAASKASHTQAGALKGKLQYMAPEQAWGRNIDRRSDVFALATVLFEMLTGRKLFTGDNELSILEQVREARVTAPSLYNDEVTPEIDQIVLKALQKDPANRYQTAGEMARDVDAVLYSFRPTPTSADLAIYMHRLSAPEPEMPELEPEPIPEPVAALPPPLPVLAPAAAPAITPPTPATEAETPFTMASVEQEPRRRKTGVFIAAAVVVVAVGAGAAYMLMPAAATSPQPVAAAATVQSTSSPALPATATAAPAESAAAVPAVATAPDTAIDPSLVDLEVQRRIAAERARLEAQARAQQQSAQTPATAPSRPAPAAPAQVAAQQPPPAAVTATQPESRPAPPPVQQPQEQPAAQVAEQPAAPQVAAPQPAAPQRAREGDLVPVGTAGLTPPRLVRRGSVTYPQIARMQRVEGTVIASVLVSETGEVLQVRVIRGVNRPVGLNEAAEQTMRRSTFAPAMKDGVRVKSWVTVPVEFKL